MAMMLAVVLSASAMSYEQARDRALFLTDKMAYELNLNDEQYEAAYEVNLDYLMSINTYDDLYGAYWTRRNLDLSYILFDWQYSTFCAAAYFYRPLAWADGVWRFPIYARYPQRTYFYFGRPDFYVTYRGGHSWHMNGGHSWYHGRSFGPRPGATRLGMKDRFDRGEFSGTRNHGSVGGFGGGNRGRNDGGMRNGRNDGYNSQNHGGNRYSGGNGRQGYNDSGRTGTGTYRGGTDNNSGGNTTYRGGFKPGNSSGSAVTNPQQRLDRQQLGTANRNDAISNSSQKRNTAVRESSTRTTVTRNTQSPATSFNRNTVSRPSTTFSPSRSSSSFSSPSPSRNSGSSFSGGSSSHGGGFSGGSSSHGSSFSGGSSNHGGGFSGGGRSGGGGHFGGRR